MEKSEVKETKKEETDVKADEKVVDETKTETKKEKKDRFNKEIEALKLEVEKAKNEASEWKDKYYRAYADMDNQRKLYQKDYQTALKYRSQDLAEKLLPSFEMFSMVVESADKLPQEVQSYVMGFDMVYRQMIQAMESENITEIKVKVGDEFDHKYHYAIETQDVDDDAMVNKIVKIVRKGYTIYDRLLKPVTVIVGKKKVVEEKEVKETKENEAKAEEPNA